jgi:hypothetical protein
MTACRKVNQAARSCRVAGVVEASRPQVAPSIRFGALERPVVFGVTAAYIVAARAGISIA